MLSAVNKRLLGFSSL